MDRGQRTGMRSTRWALILVAIVAVSAIGYLEAADPSAMSLRDESDHFLFYFDGGSVSRIRPIMDELEENYGRIVDDLGVDSMPVVSVKIWSSRRDFYEEMERLLKVSYPGADGYVFGPDELHVRLVSNAPGNAVHEFAHVVSLNLNLRFGNNPRWLWEAVAIYEAEEFVHPASLQFMVNGDYPGIPELNSDFGTGGNRIYSVGYVLTEYIIDGWGMEALRDLIVADGDLESALGMGTGKFEVGWHHWLEAEYLAPQTEELASYWPTAGWRTAKPEDLGMDAAKLEEMVETIQKQGISVDSVTVIRDGYMVLDEYFPPFKKGERHNIYSCTKSVVSTLIGIALDEGYLEGLDQRLLDLFPDRTIQNLDTWKETITLRDLLTMTAGFDARDSYLYNWVGLERMHESDDAVRYVLDLPMAEEPGTRFEYTNGVSHLLSAIITETTGMSALEYAMDRLFAPLGITDVEWKSDSHGRNWGYSSLYLKPHDMAKIGYLFLNEGQWDGEQIVPQEWVDDATAKHIDATIMDGYGYQWWVNSRGYYSAVGHKGQFIHVVPELQLVAVFTSRNADDFDIILSLLETYIIPAVIQ